MRTRYAPFLFFLLFISLLLPVRSLSAAEPEVWFKARMKAAGEGKYERAVTALRLAPGYDDAYFGRGLAFAASGQRKKPSRM